MDNTVKIGKDAQIKENVDLRYVIVGNNVKIGKNTTIFGSEDNYVMIGDNSYISPNCYFNGAFGLIIGSNVTISTGVMVFTDSGPNVGPLTEVYKTIHEKIEIGNGCWVGAGSILLPGSTMKENSILGANSTLNTLVPAGEVFAGNLAKHVKKIL